MSQDLIKIHKLHLIQARTPAVDFPRIDSNAWLEFRYINPIYPSLRLAFILHLSYHSYHYFSCHRPTSSNNVSTSPPSSYITLINPYPVTTKRSLELIPRRAIPPEDLIPMKLNSRVVSPVDLTRCEYYHYILHTTHIEEKPSSSSYTTFTKEAKSSSSTFPKEAFEPTVLHDRYKSQKKPSCSSSMSKKKP